MEDTERLYLRSAKTEDCDLLYSWVNEPSVRINSFNTNHIEYDTHRTWYNRALESNDTVIYIVMLENTPVGQVRLSIRNDIAEINYSVDAIFRGKGFGRSIIKLVINQVKNDNIKVKKLIAQVKRDNIASKNCFLANEFEERFTQYELRVDE